VSRFSDKDLRFLASRTGLTVRAVERLLGSARVPKPGRAPVDATPSTSFYEIGFRFDALETYTAMHLAHGKEGTIGHLEQALTELTRCCPAVVSWIGKGDYSPAHPPVEVSRAALLYACRSVGRIRAQVLRTCGVGRR
jgi:hypothetical protein